MVSIGMCRVKREIEPAYDEIVAFAETGKLLRMAVKRYSSGMYVRRALAMDSGRG